MSSFQKKNALIIDTHPIIVESISNYLNQNPNIDKVFHTTSMVDALNILAKEEIGFISLDIKQDNFNGLDFIKKVRRKEFDCSILVISSYGYEMYSDSAKKLGANGYISKTEATSLINNAIDNVLHGYTLFKQSSSTNNKKELSNREVIVLNYLLHGYSNKEISKQLSLSSKTISTYKSRILDKYNANSLIDLLKLNENTRLQL